MAAGAAGLGRRRGASRGVEGRIGQDQIEAAGGDLRRRAVMGKTILPLGPVGSGALVKLINNFVCGAQVAALAEATALIERSGLDRAKALEVLTGGAPGSPLVKTVSARMTAPDYTPNFLLRLMAKDLGYVLAEGRKHSLELATAATALGLFQSGIAAGDGDRDF